MRSGIPISVDFDNFSRFSLQINSTGSSATKQSHML